MPLPQPARRPKRWGEFFDSGTETDVLLADTSFKLNFALQYDPVLHQPFVVNRSPQPGEGAIYSTPAGPNPPTTGLGVIAYVPSLSGKRKTLILEGTDSQATGAAGEFVTSDDSMAAFESKFPAGPTPALDILLRMYQLSGTPLDAEIAAYRILHQRTPNPSDSSQSLMGSHTHPVLV